MIDDFEAIILSCGHSVTAYSGLGLCQGCGSKSCGKCLKLLDGKLLCPQCVKERIDGDSR